MPSSPPVFEPVNAPLYGVNLIEAGAGTGKTYTIASLVLRMLLQTPITIEQILVVTFTEAATDELRGRLYQRIGEALAILQQPDSLDQADPLLQTLLEDQLNNPQAINRLQQALYGFDEAAVFTIHGFCQRVLQEHAFESAVQFDTKIIEDEQSLLQEIVADFWRNSFYKTETLAVKTALKQYILSKYNSEKLLKLIKNYSNRLFLQLKPSIESRLDWDKLDQQYQQVQQQLADLKIRWQTEKQEVANTLLAALKEKHLDGRSYTLSNIPEKLEIIEQYLQRQDSSIALPKTFSLFCQGQMKVKKNQPVPQNPFFDACQDFYLIKTQLEQDFASGLLHWQHQAFAYCQTERKLRIQQRGELSFDDLLNNLYFALQSQEKTVLIERLQQRYHAALIDEFQDTDSLQYQIFWDIFQAPARTAEQNRSLFFIGDPKQAIYAFRGADIFTYINAAEQVDKRYTLTTNWRSQAHLVNAINHIFQTHSQPFLLADIQYHPLEAAKPSIDAYQQALQIHYLDRGILGYVGNKAVSKEKLEARIPHLLAQEILQQLADDPDLSPGDIAVLVHSNQQANDVYIALQAQALPVVLYSKQSLFESHEAQEMLAILAAIIHPYNEDGLRSALATDLMGLNAHDLAQLTDHSGESRNQQLAWETWLFRFQHYQQLWQKQGFHLMAHQLLQDLDMPVRLLSLIDGERRLTNLLHLIEVLQQAQQQGQGMRHVLQWLQQRCELATIEKEAYLLRLESDALAIKISTIHKSKGLQYPVVFLPYAWLASSSINIPFIYHADEDAKQVYLQLETDDQAKKAYLAEKMAESLRVFYVALTRAEKACHVFWAAHNTSNNPLAYLCGLDKDAVKRSDAELLQSLQSQFATKNIVINTLQLHKQPLYHTHRQDAARLTARQLTRRLQIPWQIISFSTLLRQQRPHQAIIAPRRDQHAPIEAQSSQLPASAHMGNLLHEILQYLDFQQPNFEHIDSKLQAFGYDTELKTAVCKLLDDVLQTPLDADLSLSALSKAERLNEVEFFYPLKQLDATAFNQLLQSYPLAQHSAHLQFKSLQGFMRGFIDLVFYWQGKYYLLDYKSNRLGANITDYQQSRLIEPMQQHHYVLQYLIYTVALQQYLQNRLSDYDYEQHFGGVYYLFLRGMQPELGADYGVFFDRPPQAFIDQLSELLINNQL